ncbi:MAG: hypothetical protein U1F25_16840 [Rubrivivax sp.]
MGLHHNCATRSAAPSIYRTPTHTVVLPHALAYNAAAAPAGDGAHCAALGCRAMLPLMRRPPCRMPCPGRCKALAAKHGAPTSLRALGMPAAGIDRAADLAVTTPYPNPRPLERAALRACYNALSTAPPAAD